MEKRDSPGRYVCWRRWLWYSCREWYSIRRCCPGLVPNLGVGSKGKASSTTQSIILDVILTVDDKEIDAKTENTYTERRIKMMELQKRIDILDLWDEMPY